MPDNISKIEKIRHSLAHILAMAVLELQPDAKLGYGPAIENGFYYDFLLSQPLEQKDLERIESKMREIIKKNLPFKQELWSLQRALEFYKNQPFKQELIKEKSNSINVQIYKTGDHFFDFCKGGHVENTSEIPIDAFKLEKIAGAYWKGDSKRPQLTRIYGIAFEKKEDLQNYLKIQQESKKRDHRKIGQELKLYMISDEIGPGLILWLPRGTIIRDTLEKWAVETEKKWGYIRVSTPHVAKETLFKTSGHLPYYKESMYPKMKLDDAVYYLKAMNCPMHHLIYKSATRSYRDLPLRIAEYGDVYRYEKSGELYGLMRVRGMSMNDAHIYCTIEQAVEEFLNVIKLHQYYYNILGIKDYYMELSLRDPKKKKKYSGDNEMWIEAEELMRQAMEKSGVPYVVANEGAAFYGPKIDFQIKAATGKIFTASTSQIDLFMAERFDLVYTDKDGSKKRPVIIHRAPLGTHERFIGFLIEQYIGDFPIWLAPEQITILPISDKFINYAKNILEKLKNNNIRATLDASDDSLSKKVRQAEKMKIPFIFIIGQKEEQLGTVAVRQRGKGNLGQMSLEKFLKDFGAEFSIPS